MANKEKFVDLIAKGYKSKGESITLGAAMLGDETLTGSLVNIPLKTINRHGLISGATGTGKPLPPPTSPPSVNKDLLSSFLVFIHHQTTHTSTHHLHHILSTYL